MIALLRALLEALAAYVRHLTETDLDRRIAESSKVLRELAAEIDDLRAGGSAADTERADWLRAEYALEAAHLEHLRARRAEPAGR